MGFFGGNKKIDSDGTEIFKIKLGLVLMQVYENRVVTTVVGISNTLYFSEISAIEFKESGITSGYIEFVYPNSKRKSLNETYFVFNKKENNSMREIKDFIDSRIRLPREEASPKESKEINFVATELVKLKELVDAGILTQEEFNHQKDKLLR